MLRVEHSSGVVTLEFGSLARQPGVRHFVSCRTGGVSGGPFASLNLGYTVNDKPVRVARNRGRLCRALGLDLDALTFGAQCHSGSVAVVTPAERGCGARDPATALCGADALTTSIPGVCLVVLVADCVPILLYDPVARAVGAVHAGWRGTVSAIAANTVETMSAAHRSRPSDVHATIGPAISADDYEVGPEVVAALLGAMPRVAREVLRPTKRGHALLDLPHANRLQLEAAGVRADRIEQSSTSTYCAPDLLYSARRDGPRTGRFAAGIMLRD